MKTDQRRMMVPDDTTVDEDDRAGDARLVEETHADGGTRSVHWSSGMSGDSCVSLDASFVMLTWRKTSLRRPSYASRRIEQFDPSRRFAPWLFQIGVNLALDYHRKQKRRRRIWSFFFTDQAGDRYPDPATADPRVQQELHEEIRSVIDQVPEQFRTVLILRDLEGFSTSEIAAILDRKEATIRWRLAEARNRFQEAWTRRQPKP